MADGPYRHHGAGNGQQQQSYFHLQQAQNRHLARSGSPVNVSGNLFGLELPSPSRSPNIQSSIPFNMYSQGQNNLINGGSHQRYMHMNAAHKFQQPHQHHNQQGHHHGQQNHNAHAGHGGIGHQHSISGGFNLGSNHNFGAALQNGGLEESHAEINENYPEHWQYQLQLAADARQNINVAHRHSKKSGALLSTRLHQQSQSEDSGDGVERNRAPQVFEEPRQEWDGLDFSGQGLRCITLRLFRDYTFLTRLYIDNNKIGILPPTISSLRSLIVLSASNNRIAELPNTIGMLSRLEELLLFDNMIRTIPVEMGYLFKLQILGIEGNPLDKDTKEFLMQNGTQQLVTHLRDNTEPGPPPRPRPMVVIDDSEAQEKFTALSYNILCDRYATASHYQYTPARAIDWEYRRNLILEEIKHYNADIVCLQEIDLENYEEFLRGHLAHYHYKGLFWQKARARTMGDREAKLVDGCAILYKSQKFIYLDKHSIDFANTAINRPDMKGEHDIFNRVMPRDHISLIAFLENRMTGSRIIVANAHLDWDPKFTDVKVVQTAILLDQLQKQAEKWCKLPAKTDKALFRFTSQDSGNENDPLADPEPAAEPAPSREYTSPTQIPVLICGDFNSVRGSGVHQLITKGALPADHPDLGGRRYGVFTREGISHPFSLKSAYDAEQGGYYIQFTNYTPGYHGNIDYIWHTPNLRRRRILGELDGAYLETVPGFPNYHFPSDHLPLLVEFHIEHRKEMPKVEPDFGPSSRDRKG